MNSTNKKEGLSKPSKYEPQKRYAKKLALRTKQITIRLYTDQDQDIIDYLKPVKDTNHFIKKILRAEINKKS